MFIIVQEVACSLFPEGLSHSSSKLLLARRGWERSLLCAPQYTDGPSRRCAPCSVSCISLLSFCPLCIYMLVSTA